MSEETKNTKETEVTDEQLEDVSGGSFDAVRKRGLGDIDISDDGVTEDRAQELAADGTEAEGGPVETVWNIKQNKAV